MQPMTGKERMLNAIGRMPVDRLPVFEEFWPETVQRYTDEGHDVSDPVAHFDFDMRAGGWLNSVLDLDFENQVIEETDETILQLDGNGATLRRHKLHAATPEHVDFAIRDRASWEEHGRPFLAGTLDRRRVPFADYREQKRRAAEEGRALFWWGVGPFEQMHPVCGHEYMLMGMALDPEWVRDMVAAYCEMTVNGMEVLFSEEGAPDVCFFFEDMGFKHKPFMSPGMYQEIVQPGHKRLFDFAHAHGCPVMVHSCGFVEPLVPGLVEAGMDCLQAMEVKAGMDMPRLFARFGERISFCGGVDVRELISNDRGRIDAEMDAKVLPVLDGGGGWVVHSDHSIPPQVDYETLQYFLRRGREMAGAWRRA